MFACIYIYLYVTIYSDFPRAILHVRDKEKERKEKHGKSFVITHPCYIC